MTKFKSRPSIKKEGTPLRRRPKFLNLSFKILLVIFSLGFLKSLQLHEDSLSFSKKHSISMFVELLEAETDVRIKSKLKSKLHASELFLLNDLKNFFYTKDIKFSGITIFGLNFSLLSQLKIKTYLFSSNSSPPLNPFIPMV